MNIVTNRILRWIRSEWTFILVASAAFLLVPRGFELGGESWSAWAAARHLADTG